MNENDLELSRTLWDKSADWSLRPGQIFCNPEGVLLLVFDPRLADSENFLAMCEHDGGERVLLLSEDKTFMECFMFVGVLDDHYERPEFYERSEIFD